MGHLYTMMPAASALLGTLGRRSAPSVRSPRSRSGQFASFSIARDVFETGRCSIWQSTASFADVT